MSGAVAEGLDLEAVNARLDGAHAKEIVRWAADTFGDRLVLSSSFGAQSAVMLHLATSVVPSIPVVLVDTGYLFAETYRFVERLRERLGLNLHVYSPAMTAARFEALYGRLWEHGPEGEAKYLRMRKREPMERALRELDVAAWLAGLRAEQTDHRSQLRVVEAQDGRYKVHPILHWTTKDVHEYLKAHDLPYHPLYHQGYASIGDWHSSFPVTAEVRERAGRFRSGRQECGLHLPASEREDESRASSDL